MNLGVFDIGGMLELVGEFVKNIDGVCVLDFDIVDLGKVGGCIFKNFFKWF